MRRNNGKFIVVLNSPDTLSVGSQIGTATVVNLIPQQLLPQGDGTRIVYLAIRDENGRYYEATTHVPNPSAELIGIPEYPVPFGV